MVLLALAASSRLGVNCWSLTLDRSSGLKIRKSACGPTIRSWLGCAKSNPAPPVARSLEMMSSLFDSVTCTSMPVSCLNFFTSTSGARSLQVSSLKVSAEATLAAAARPTKPVSKTSRFIFIIVASPLTCFLSTALAGRCLLGPAPRMASAKLRQQWLGTNTHFEKIWQSIFDEAWGVALEHKAWHPSVPRRRVPRFTGAMWPAQRPDQSVLLPQPRSRTPSRRTAQRPRLGLTDIGLCLHRGRCRRSEYQCTLVVACGHPIIMDCHFFQNGRLDSVYFE